METCFKLHGNETVLSRIGSFKNMKSQSFHVNKEQEEEANKGEVEANGTTIPIVKAKYH